MSQTRPSSVNPQLQVTTETSSDPSTIRLSGTLRLRGEDSTTTTRESSSARHIQWSEDVVDNEGMGKKSSKGLSFFLGGGESTHSQPHYN